MTEKPYKEVLFQDNGQELRFMPSYASVWITLVCDSPNPGMWLDIGKATLLRDWLNDVIDDFAKGGRQ